MNVSFNLKLMALPMLILFCFCSSFLSAADGFGGNADGGADGTNVVVKTAVDLITYATSSLPYIITVSGTINLTDNLDIASDKTIQGEDTNSTVIGNLRIVNDIRNVIIQNLNITNPNGTGEGDGITVRGSKNVFITHCTFTDCSDGSIDIVQQADSVTISWCRFHYVHRTSHCYVNLIGNSDSRTDDLGYLHVTIHHCWYDMNCVERMPSVRFGRVHVYNNYYNADSIKYGVRTRLYAECLVEGNYFENMKNPWELLTTTGITGKLNASNNNVSFMDTSFGVAWVSGWYPGQSLIPGEDSVFSPPYSYILDPVNAVKTKLVQYAGNKANITGIQKLQSGPSDFVLHQNFPNPFNPNTTIKYSIPKESFVTIKVYNILGKEISALVSGRKYSGNYSINFDASNLPSGVYFYRLQAVPEGRQAGSFVSTKKFVLLK
jgi:pectate lyase